MDTSLDSGKARRVAQPLSAHLRTPQELARTDDWSPLCFTCRQPILDSHEGVAGWWSDEDADVTYFFHRTESCLRESGALRLIPLDRIWRAGRRAA